MIETHPVGGHAALLESFDAGRRIALARAISVVEDGRPGYQQLLAALHGRVGRAQRLGITGPPGAGKSTLTAALVRHYREEGETVGVVAVDPSSPFSGGALLGDRIRMNELATDPGVFIRSMATRGSLGGLALASKEVADVMDAWGFDRVILETVGVGQSELDVAAAADTTVVVLVPESGDSVQTMKAGLMEISDIFVVNKADRPGAERLARELEMMLGLRIGAAFRNVPGHHGVNPAAAARKKAGKGDVAADGAPADDGRGGAGAWGIPVLRASAEKEEGILDLADMIARHRTWLEESGELERRRRQRAAERVREAVEREIRAQAWEGGEPILEEALPRLLDGSETPYDVAARIVRAVLG